MNSNKNETYPRSDKNEKVTRGYPRYFLASPQNDEFEWVILLRRGKARSKDYEGRIEEYRPDLGLFFHHLEIGNWIEVSEKEFALNV